MNHLIEKYKGIHPGFVIEHLLKKRLLRKRPFALSVNEYPQTLNAITKGKRSLNTALALKIEKQLDLEQGTLALLQTYFDIEQETKKLDHPTPNLNLLRTSLFWDTDMSKIDWNRQYKAVIKRIFERGNEAEQNEIRRFYGSKKIKTAVQSDTRKHYRTFHK
ncbi:plasmid maintenance system antidote protein [Tamlana sp. 2_MG-2023]|uniref:helix-turn-helix transcriptional regulator n=1 Tax=unclassified Tamlana TaxID=2614803 RepID=UPI0026E2AACF|nr:MULTISPECIES: plasmid maintenance system antidote protein [unclassified Tamlana]MDO6761888.1 plasmid maintenance system antidote protein [Tamlana sp. 2_MG-2023]MDO6792650.1 plasmid maintenance system antidote protein [Tamlana sp. 1_MG-2023]